MSSFSDRRKALFDCLSDAESQFSKKIDEFKKPDSYHESNSVKLSNTKMKQEMKHFRGRNSMYSRPEVPIGQCLPSRSKNFQRDPKKWSHYTLEDVPDVSERSNAAALADLRKAIEKDRNAERSDDITDADDRIRFKLPIRDSTDNDDGLSEQERTVFVNSKRILPEYIVGQKQTKSKRISRNTGDKKPELKLNHLIEDEDDENET